MLRRLVSKIRKHFKAVLKTKSSPHSIAFGAAIGTLIGTLPAPFFDFFIAILILLLFKNISKYASFTSVVFWNPLTRIPIYSLSYALGNLVFADAPTFKFEIMILNSLYSYSRRLLIGNIIISLGLTLSVYLLVYGIVYYIKSNR